MSHPAEAGGDDDLVAGTLVGEYEVECLLGAGGMGEVYRARHPVIGKRVAIKVMSRHCSANPINVERFVQEAKAVNAIGHANIVDIFSFGKMADGRCFFVMECLAGASLRDEIDRGAVTPARALDVLDAVLRALEAAHAAGIVHRDLKPDNIFLVAAKDGEPERVKLLDFGIAKLADDGALARNNRTKTGTVIGTPSYMAPEQASGAAITGQSDVYSLGVVAYEMAAGKTPFDAESAVQIMAKHVDEIPKPPSSVRPVTRGVDRLVLDMLAKAPTARPSPAEARTRIARLRVDPGEVTVHTTPEATAPVRVVMRDKASESTMPLALEVERPVARGARAATAPTTAAAVAATPAPDGQRSSRRGWMIVALLGGLGIAVIAAGAYTSSGHGANAPAVPPPVVTPAAMTAAPVAAPLPAAAPAAAPIAVAPPPARPPQPIVAPPPPPAKTVAHKPAPAPAKPIAPAVATTPPPAAAAPVVPVKHDVDAIVDPYGSGAAP